MANYKQSFDFINDTDMQGRVNVGLRKMAVDVTNESPATQYHAARLNWAEGLLHRSNLGEMDITGIMYLCTTNATLMAHGLTPANEDTFASDLDFVLSGFLNSYIINVT